MTRPGRGPQAKLRVRLGDYDSLRPGVSSVPGPARSPLESPRETHLPERRRPGRRSMAAGCDARRARAGPAGGHRVPDDRPGIMIGPGRPRPSVRLDACDDKESEFWSSRDSAWAIRRATVGLRVLQHGPGTDSEQYGPSAVRPDGPQGRGSTNPVLRTSNTLRSCENFGGGARTRSCHHD